MISPLDEYSTFEISIHPSSYPPLSSTSRPYEKKGNWWTRWVRKFCLKKQTSVYGNVQILYSRTFFQIKKNPKECFVYCCQIWFKNLTPYRGRKNLRKNLVRLVNSQRKHAVELCHWKSSQPLENEIITNIEAISKMKQFIIA